MLPSETESYSEYERDFVFTRFHDCEFGGWVGRRDFATVNSKNALGLRMFLSENIDFTALSLRNQGGWASGLARFHKREFSQ